MKKTFKHDIEKLKNNRLFLIVMILFFVCAMFWTTIGLVSSQTSSVISAEQRQLSKPLNPTLDVAIISKLETKRFMNDAELSNFPIFKLITDGGSISRVVPLSVSEENYNFQTGQENQSGTLLEDELLD